ncbi:uncharacterized protein LOC142644441 [Castanea sativa]|uniref:uncharacterized protein LOC142644441 n=1 Tax=Castanea sativa TaxID=21020 RepID=UPI003F653F46
MENLRSRGISVEDLCPLCNQSSESTSHALIHCVSAAKVWSNWTDCPIKLQDTMYDISDIALELLNIGFAQDLEVLFSTVWFIWYNRNQVIHEQPGWTTPPYGFYKINVDGATSQDHRLSSIGALIRSSDGSVIAAISKVLPVHYTVEEVEAIALECGVLLAQELNLTDIIVESDALSMQFVQKKELNGNIGHILQGVLSALSDFRSWKIQHLKRESNRAAHELAQLARASGESQIWKGMNPPCIQNLLRQECI